MVIDLQNDFLHPRGFCCTMPEVDEPTVERVRSIIPRVLRMIDWARDAGVRVVYTRESHHGDLSDVTPSKQKRYENAGYPIGAPGKFGGFLIRGDHGSALIDEIAPVSGEWQYDKPGQSAFYATSLESDLRHAGIDTLLFTGVTTECCVLATYRQAADMGFFTLLLEDCCAAFDPREHEAAIDVLLGENGAIGWVATSLDVIDS
jgi:nicotinamidase-related amidase